MLDESLKITLIIPYFGKWPTYLNVYLKGCEHNKWLNVIFFTDCKIPDNHPEHVTFIPYNLERLSKLISEKLQREFTIKYPYKLCDFKPCYGLIFEDYLKDSDYWGYGDIDLIYGDLQPHITNRIKEGFDVLSNRKEILSGSLSLFRNTDLLKNLFSKSSTLIALLSASTYKGLDETAHNNITWQGGDKLDLPHHCFTYLVANESQKGNINASFISYCKEYIHGHQAIRYQDGHLWFENTSIAYYHYVNNKNKDGYKLPNWNDVPSNFFITSTGFYRTHKFHKLIHYYRKASWPLIKLSSRLWKRLKQNF